MNRDRNSVFVGENFIQSAVRGADLPNSGQVIILGNLGSVNEVDGLQTKTKIPPVEDGQRDNHG